MRKTNTLAIIKAVLLVAVTAIISASCQYMPPVPPPAAPNTIFQKISTDNRFQYLTVAVTRAGLVGTLSDKNAQLLYLPPPTRLSRTRASPQLNL